MALGVFDSGVGGLTIHRAIAQKLPAADLIYLADQARVPYGNRSGQEIVALTRACCDRLFREGCNLVVLACNTASAVALRQLQQNWIPDIRRTLRRTVNVLGIIVPTIEAATSRPWHGPHDTAVQGSRSQQVIGVFATWATARTQVYEIEVSKRRKDLSVVMEVCLGLAAMIEAGAETGDISEVISKHVSAMTRLIGRAPDKAILGSTHYEVVSELFRRALPRTTDLIHQPSSTADALQAYIRRHPEYHLGTQGLRRFLTTGRPGMPHALMQKYWGEPLLFEAISS